VKTLDLHNDFLGDQTKFPTPFIDSTLGGAISLLPGFGDPPLAGGIRNKGLRQIRIYEVVPETFDKSHILNTVAGLNSTYAEYDISRAPDARKRAKAGS
jgi:hypothetical protein